MTRPLVVTVVLNWNSGDELLDCVKSLAVIDYPNHQIVLVDNHSTDDSIERVRAVDPDVPILHSHVNMGYAGGNNLGIRWAMDRGAQWIWILNTDVLLAPDALSCLIGTGGASETNGFIGPTVYYAEAPTIIQSAGGLCDTRWNFSHRGKDQPDMGQYPETGVVDWITGCAILARAEMIRQIGLLDERFFAYYEEVDWCLRARAAGWRSVHIPQAHVWHSGVTTNYQPKPNITYYMTRNKLYLLKKHNAGMTPRLLTYFSMCRTFANWTYSPSSRCKREHRNAMAQAVFDHLFHRYGKQPVLSNNR